jgi:di/tricarboxylate transporter
MTTAQLYLILVVAVPLILVVANRLRADIAALIIAVLLGIGQYAGLAILGKANTPTDASQALAGFRQPAVMTLFGLFIITRALDKVGVTRLIAQRVLQLGGKSEPTLVALFTTTTALLSLFMNNLAAGALMLPSAMDVSRRTGITPAKLLIPVAYGSLLGGAATYFTTANIIVSDLLTNANPPQAALHVLDFTPTGGLIAIAGIAFMVLVGRKLLPDRAPNREQMIARRTTTELEEAYQLDERLWEAKVPATSPIVGKSLSQAGIGERLGIAVAAVWHGSEAIFAPPPSQVIHANDILLTIGREDRVTQLANQGLKVGRDTTNGHITTRGVSLIEIVPSPRSHAIDHNLKELNFRKLYGFTAVALLREGRSFRTDVADIPLKAGDSILIVGERSKLKALQLTPDFIVLETDTSDEPIDKKQASIVVGVTVAAIVASILGVPVYLAMLAAALFILSLGLITMEESYRTMEWQALFMIAGMYSVSIAMVQTGIAQNVGQFVVNVVTPFGPLGLAAGAYLLTALLTQVMGGQVTVLVTGPIAISAAIALHTNPQAMAVAAAIGCSASFLTPIAHPVNILMIGPGNYKFGDFFRVGWGLTIISFIALLIGMILFWKL